MTKESDHKELQRKSLKDQQDKFLKEGGKITTIEPTVRVEGEAPKPQRRNRIKPPSVYN